MTTKKEIETVTFDFYGSRVCGKHPNETISEGEEFTHEVVNEYDENGELTQTLEYPGAAAMHDAVRARACALGEIWGSSSVKIHERDGDVEFAYQGQDYPGPKYKVSAPSLSGFEAVVSDLDAARAKCAELLGIEEGDMEERETPDGECVCCYASEEDADADQDGAYAVSYEELR